MKPRSYQQETQTSYTERGNAVSLAEMIEMTKHEVQKQPVRHLEQNMSDASLDMVAYHLCNCVIMEPQPRHMKKNLVKASGREKLCRCASRIFKVLHMSRLFCRQGQWSAMVRLTQELEHTETKVLLVQASQARSC